MTDITVLSRLLNGAMRNVDLTSNTPVVFSIKVGGGVTNTELTKAILDSLIANNHAPMSDNQNITAGSGLSGGGSGATVSLAVDSTVVRTNGANAFSADQSMGSHKITNLADGSASGDAVNFGQVSSLVAGGGSKVKVSATDTTSDYLGASLVAGAGLSSSILNSGADEQLSLDVNVDGSSIEINSDTLRVKAAGITSAMLAGSIDATKIADGSVSSTKFQYLSGVTSDIQTQINSKANSSLIGANNGIASLDAGGKVPMSQLPAGIFEFAGNWDPSTNTPTLSDSTVAVAGITYWVSAAHAAAISGLADASMYNFQIGDLVISNGTAWVLSSPAAGVQSVNGAQGAITVNAINQLTGDITAGPASGSQSAAATIAAGAVTSSKIATGTIVNSNISASAAIAYSKLALSNSIVAGDITSGAVSLAKLASNSVDENKIVSTSFDAAGAIAGGSGTKIAVQVDNSTVEISSNALRVKDAGITLAKLASASVDENKLTASVAGNGLTGGAGSPLAVGNTDLSITVTADAISVNSSPRIVTSGINAGETFAATLLAARWAKPADAGFVAGTYYKADNDASSADNFYVVGLATAGATSGTSLKIYKFGVMTATAHGFTVGAPLFLGAGGVITETPPTAANTAVVRVGIAASANTIDVQIQVIGVN